MSLGTKRLLLALFFASSTVASPVPQLGPKLHFPRFANISTSNPHASISTSQSVITPNAVQSVHAADTGIPFVVPVTLLTSDGSIIQEISTSPIISPVTPPSTPEPSTSTFFSVSTPATFSQTPNYNLSTPSPGLSGGFQGAEASVSGLTPTTTSTQNSSPHTPTTYATGTPSRLFTPSKHFTYDPIPGTKSPTLSNATTPASFSFDPSTPTSSPSTPTLTPIKTPSQFSTPIAANATASRKTLSSGLPATPTDAARSSSGAIYATTTAHSTPLISTPNGQASLTPTGTPVGVSQSGPVYVTTTIHPVQSSQLGTLRKTTTILTTVTPDSSSHVSRSSSLEASNSLVYVTTTIDPTPTSQSTLHLTKTVMATITPAQQSSTPAPTPEATTQSSPLADSGTDGSLATQESQKLPQTITSKTTQSTPSFTSTEAAITNATSASAYSTMSASPSRESSAPSAASSPSASRETAATTSATQAPASSTTAAPAPSTPSSSSAADDDDGGEGITIIPVDPSVSTYTETTTQIKTVTLRETVTARETITIRETDDAPRVTVTAYDTLMMKLGERK